MRGAGRRFARVALLITALPACRGKSSEPTWARDVAPILEERCGRCHGDGDRPALAPPPLGGYDEASRVAGEILLSVRRRRMPPFGVDNTGRCGQWLDAPWLDEVEIETLAQWARSGAPRGDGEPRRDEPRRGAPGRDGEPRRDEPRRGVDHARMSGAPPDTAALVLDPGKSFSPDLGTGAYRCLLVDPRLDHDALITAMSIASEPEHAIRQASLHELDDDGAITEAERLDAAGATPGWACYGGPGIARSRLIMSWSWATPHLALPPPTAVRLRAGRRAVLQLFYDLVAIAPGTPVSARAVLMTDPGARAAVLIPLSSERFTLPAGRSQTEVGAELVLDRPFVLHGLVPHMHTLGRLLQVERRRGERRDCLAYFGHWDFYERQLFRSAKPIRLDAGDRVSLSCTFATSSRDEETRSGEAPDEEECRAHLFGIEEAGD